MTPWYEHAAHRVGAEDMLCKVQDSLAHLMPINDKAANHNYNYTIEEVSDPRRWPYRGRISDHANIIDFLKEREITSEIHRIESDVMGSSVLVVTVDAIDSQKYYNSPKYFATRLFNLWKIGSREKNNGVLVLAVQSARRIEIEVGIGLEWHMTKEWCTSMLEYDVVPKFKAGEYGKGLLVAVEQIGKKMRNDRAALWNKRTNGLPVGWIAFTTLALGYTSYSNHKYDLRSRACGNCNMVVRKSDIESWETTRSATHRTRGEIRRKYTCIACGHHGAFYQTTPMYDSVRYREDGSPHYYNRERSSSSSSNSGGSSRGGGGGASW